MKAGLAAASLIAAGIVQAAPAERERFDASSVSIERQYASVDGSQIHYRRGAPRDGSAAVKRPLLLLHQSPNSSQVFVEFIGQMATDRLVIAPDTPGFGDSDRPDEPPEVDDYANAMAGFIETLELGAIDVLGYHTGASIASALATRGDVDVRHVMLVGVALFDDAEAQRFFEQPWPPPGDFDADYLTAEWARSMRWRGPGQSDASVRRTYLAKIGAGKQAWWGARAVFRDRARLRQRLIDIRQPLLVVNPKDDLSEIAPRVRSLRPDVDVVDLPDLGFGAFEVAPQRLAAIARGHFDETAKDAAQQEN